VARGPESPHRQFASEHLVEDDHPEGVDVGAMVHRGGALTLLGRHVLRAAHHHVFAGQLGLARGVLADDPRYPEVGQLRRPGRIEEDVPRLQVAVDDPVVVCVLESRADALHEPSGLVGRKVAFAQEAVPQASPLDVLHYEVVSVPLDPLVEDAHDVRMGESREGRGLAVEALDELAVGGERRGQDLQGHRPTEG